MDTRSLVAYIRDNGAMNAVITTDVENIEQLKKAIGRNSKYERDGIGF